MWHICMIPIFGKIPAFRGSQQRRSGKGGGGGKPGEFGVKEAKGMARRRYINKGPMLQGVCGACELR